MRYFCVVKYDGTNYSGWQIQPDAISVEETIENVLSKILNTPTKIYGSGRTDAGVHAYGQTFHFDSKKIEDTNRFLYSLNSLLNKDIRVISLNEVDESFNARISAKEKTYLYKINMGDFDVFNRNFIYQLMVKLDVEKMKKASKYFIGKHNFQNFTSKEEDNDNFVREIYKINFLLENDTLSIEFIGNGFMKYMVRFIVGTLIQVGLNKLEETEVEKLINKSPRQIVSFKAPSCGLYLEKVSY